VRHPFANAQWRMGLQMRIVSIALASVVAIGLLWSVAVIPSWSQWTARK
jgi:hypothetical protein